MMAGALPPPVVTIATPAAPAAPASNRRAPGRQARSHTHAWDPGSYRI